MVLSVLVLFSFGTAYAQQTSTDQTTTPTNPPSTTQPSVTSGKTITVTGEVVCSKCYSMKGATGASHKDCAMSCAKGGVSLAILTKDGDLYYPVVDQGQDPNAQLIDHVAEQVEVTGTYADRSDKTKGITITSVKPVSNIENKN